MREGDFLRPPHGTTPAAVIKNTNKKSLDPLRVKRIFIRKAEDGPYLDFSYKSLISDPIRSGKRSQRKILQICKFNIAVVSKTDISRKLPK